MRREIEAQPDLLAALAPRYAERLRHLVRPGFELAVLAARGSSDNAALYARYLFEIHLGIPVSLAAPSVWTRYQATISYPPCLAIGISQSGAAPDVSEVLASIRAAGHQTLGLTNTAGSRLTDAAEHHLLLEVGEERAVAATKTYSASLLALYQTVEALGGGLGEPRLPAREHVEIARDAAQDALPRLLRCSHVFVLGRGYDFATCQETALKLMECALIPAKPFSTADFEHGPKALAGPGTAAIVYGEVSDSLAETGTTVSQAPDVSPGPSSPLTNIMFGQWLAYYAAIARGCDPDEPANLTKITQTL
jgi:glutamine---fructose-6-phosphate transaminase (isomerizing)